VSENYFEMLVETAKEAFEGLVEDYKGLFEDAQIRPSLTDAQKLQELQEFQALPLMLQEVAMGRMRQQGIDPEKWLSDRQRLLERKRK